MFPRRPFVQLRVFPYEAGGAGGIGVSRFDGVLIEAHFPFLGPFVELDPACPTDFECADFFQRQLVRPERRGGAVVVEGDDVIAHVRCDVLPVAVC